MYIVLPENMVLPAAVKPLPVKYMISAVVVLCGTIPEGAATVPVFVIVSEILPNVLVFGEASGADCDNKPAINLKISDTSDVGVKLLK